MKFTRRREKFFYLFTALIGLVVVYPFFESGALRNGFLILLSTAIPATGVYAVSESRQHLFVALALGVPSLIGGLEALAGFDLLPGRALGLVFALAFYLFVLVSIASHVFSREEVATDTLFGAACVYLLLGLVWTLAYTLLEQLQPGSFSFVVAPEFADAPMLFDFVYYSYVTLTTLGYGDITPVTAAAQRLAILEAITGVLFVALLVARLVGMYSQPKSNS